MTTRIVTELIVDASAAEQGTAAYIRAMKNAERERDRLTEVEEKGRAAQQRQTAVLLGLSDSIGRTRTAWNRLKEGMDPVARATREFETATLRADAAVRRGIATHAEANRVLALHKQRLDEVTRAQQAASRAPSPIRDAASGALQGFAGRSAVGGALVGMGGAGLAGGAVVAGIGAATAALTTYGDAWTSMGNRLRAAGIASADLAAEQTKVVDIAMSSRSELAATNDLYSKFIGVTQTLGVSQNQAAVATKAVAQALQLGGGSAEQARGTILQLGQALGSGVLRGDEFNSMMEGLGAQSPLVRAIANEFGVATSELRGLAEAGDLVSDRVFKAIIDAGPQIAAAFKESIPTVSASFTNLATASGEFFGVIDERIGFTAQLATNMGSLAAGIRNVVGAMRGAGAGGAPSLGTNGAKLAEDINRDLLTGPASQIFPLPPEARAELRAQQAEVARQRALQAINPGGAFSQGQVLGGPLVMDKIQDRYVAPEESGKGSFIKPEKVARQRSASTALTPAERGENAFERALAEQKRRNELLGVEADNIGKSSAERERAETIINLESKAMEANRLARMADISVTDQQRVAILAMADATATATQRLQEAKEAEKERISAMDSMRDATKGTISDIAHGIAEGKSGKEIAKSLLTKISSSMIDTGAQNLTDLLLDKQGKEGGGWIGGIISSFLGAPKTTATMAVTAGVVNVGGVGLPIPGAANSNMPLTGSGSVTSAPLSSVYAAQMNGGGPGASFQGAVAAGGSVAAMTGPLMSGGKLNPGAAFAYLRSKGMSDVQAAVALGTFRQESSFNPSNLNRGEGAFGLYQTRLGRRSGLEAFAAQRGVPASDPQAQMDFMLKEMQTTEAGPGSAFLRSTDLAGANSAMKRFIRYGDDSQGARLGYAQGYMNQFGGQQQPIAAPALDKVAASLQKVNQAAVPVAPALADASKGFEGVGSSLGSIGSMLGGAIGGPKGGSIGGAIGGIFSQIFSLFQFADGGIMTPRGPLPLMSYAGGGIVDRPQLRLAGEGSMNEAIVPLPNGRSIPVQMRGGLSRPANSNRAGGGFSFRGGDNNFTFNGGKPDEEMLNAMKREVAASEARTKADMVRNWAAYQQAHANGFG